MLEFLASRIVGMFWSAIIVFVLLGNLQWDWEDIETNHPHWRWVVACYVSVSLHCLLALYEGKWQWRRPPLKRVLALLIGGWVGLLAWVVAFTAMGVGWAVGGTWGLAIGVIIAKITYIPWIAGVVRESVRKDRTTPERTSA